jgi:hypothetical protein
MVRTPITILRWPSDSFGGSLQKIDSLFQERMNITYRGGTYLNKQILKQEGK